MPRSMFLILLFALGLIVPTIAHGQDDTGATAQIRFAHLSADAPAVDIYIDGELSNIRDLQPRNVTGWIPLSSGAYRVVVTPAGTPITNAVVGPIFYELNAGDWTTIAIIGSIQQRSLATHRVDEDYTGIPGGQARVTVLHAIENAGAVDLLANGELFIQNLAYPGSFGGNDGLFSITIPAVSYDFLLRPTDDQNRTFINTAGVRLIENTNYLIAAVGPVSNAQFVIASTSMATAAATVDSETAMNLFEDENVEEEPALQEDAFAEDGEEAVESDALVQQAEPIDIVTALNATVEALPGDSRYTIFVPTDEAVAGLDENVVNILRSDETLLQNTLRYHIVEGEVSAEAIAEFDSLTTIQGATLNISETIGEITVNGAPIVVRNIPAARGIIHVVDGVFTPPERTELNITQFEEGQTSPTPDDSDTSTFESETGDAATTDEPTPTPTDEVTAEDEDPSLFETEEASAEQEDDGAPSLFEEGDETPTVEAGDDLPQLFDEVDAPEEESEVAAQLTSTLTPTFTSTDTPTDAPTATSTSTDAPTPTQTLTEEPTATEIISTEIPPTDTPAPTPTEEPREESGHLRLANFSPGTPPLDVYINARLSDVQELRYLRMTEWDTLPVGEYTLTFVETGAPIEQALIPPVTLTLENDQWITVPVIGELVRQTVTAHVLVEDYSPIEGATARVTLFHGMPTFPPINLRVQGGELLIQTLAYPGAMGDNDGAVSLDIQADVYDLVVTPAGNSTITVVELPARRLNPNRNYFFAVVGLADNPQLVISVTDHAEYGITGDTSVASAPPQNDAITPAADTEDEATFEPENENEDATAGDPAPAEIVALDTPVASMRVAHFSPDVGPVDVYINGRLSDIQNVPFANITDWLQFPTGTYSIAVTPADEPIEEAIIGPADLTLVSGMWVTLAATGTLENATVGPRIVLEDYTIIQPNDARVTVVHAIPDAAPITISRDGDPLLEDFTYAAGFDILDIRAGDFELDIAPADPDEEEPAFNVNVSFQDNHNYLLAIIGSVSEENTQVILIETDQGAFEIAGQ